MEAKKNEFFLAFTRNLPYFCTAEMKRGALKVLRFTLKKSYSKP